jgi:hypothetical protein
MNQCSKLFHTENLCAYFSSAQKLVVIVADVFLNPYSDRVHICPSLLSRPAQHEYVVEGTTKPGIHPMLIAKERITASFASETAPPQVIVYTQGVDAPARNTVAVAAAPPPPLTPSAEVPAAVATAPSPSAMVSPVEILGYSSTFSYEDALQDAIGQARAKLPPRNPDIGIRVDVVQVYASVGGNIRPGLFLKAQAR